MQDFISFEQFSQELDAIHALERPQRLSEVPDIEKISYPTDYPEEFHSVA